MNETQNIPKKESLIKKPHVQSIISIVVIAILLGGFIFWQSSRNTVSIENSFVEAPVIALSSNTPGTLNALYVKEGQIIDANSAIGLVGTATVNAKQSGIIISAPNQIGTYFNPGQTIVSMVHPEDLRIVGAVDENKGLSDVKVGQKATFTVDTFGSKVYTGNLDSISSTSDDTGVLFSISDKRPTKKFDVKIRFNVADYPELKNGMSAKITVYTK